MSKAGPECVLCHEFAKPNRCVFKCFAKVSKLQEEDLKSTGKAFQLLGPATILGHDKPSARAQQIRNLLQTLSCEQYII